MHYQGRQFYRKILELPDKKISLAVQPSAKSNKISFLWPHIWKLSLRHLTASATCRIASQLLTTLLTFELVKYESVAESLDNMLTSMDLNGPIECDASSLSLWTTVMKIRQSQNLLAEYDVCRTILRWLFRCWCPCKWSALGFSTRSR